MSYKGTIIEESLADKSVLQQIKIISTRVEPVTDAHKTPWLKQWTLHFVEIPEGREREITEMISSSIEREHLAWYADFRGKTHHYIIFPHKIFFIDRKDVKHYNEAKAYGISLGIPEHQVDFHPDIKKWER